MSVTHVSHIKKGHVFTTEEQETFNANIRLVYKMMKKNKHAILLRRAGYSREEIIQIGCLGLLNSCRTGAYDPARGYKFSTFACNSIVNTWNKELQHRFTKKNNMQRSNHDKLLDFVASGDEVESVQPEVVDVDQLADLVDQLNPLEKSVISAYFGLNREVPGTLRNLAVEFGYSAERIRQIIKEGIRKMRIRLSLESSAD